MNKRDDTIQRKKIAYFLNPLIVENEAQNTTRERVCFLGHLSWCLPTHIPILKSRIIPRGVRQGCKKRGKILVADLGFVEKWD